MKYRKLGNTGLIVSEVALGTMQFGGKMNMGNLGQEETTRMVKLALDRGINFIDTADVYSPGRRVFRAWRAEDARPVWR
jgi:aryl-alcohol dehydrogenase-like predicted oxidoreductase